LIITSLGRGWILVPRRLIPLGVAVIASTLAVASASGSGAGRPANDRLTDAQALRLPALVAGSTKGASTERPRLACSAAENDVWYGLASSRRGPILVRLTAAGKLDAVVGVYRRARSRLYPVACGTTNAKGRLLLPFYGRRHAEYVVVVAQRTESAPGSFRLRAFRAERPARPPGQLLPAGGVRSAVHPLFDRDDAWSILMNRGQSYRINLVPGRGCLPLHLFRPGTYSFRADTPVLDLKCGGYALFTPGPDGGGRYSLLVVSDTSIGNRQRYRLQVAPAETDDVAPGILLSSGARISDRLSGRGVDLVDLYRFGAAGPSEFRARLVKGPRASFALTLLTPSGDAVPTVRSIEDRRIILRKRLPRGHYYLAVRAEDRSGGPYQLELLVRTVTTTEMLVSGSSALETEPNQALPLTATVTPPGTGGAVRFQFDRFDPLTDWHFVQTLDAPVGPTGLVATTWVPPTVGYWRIRARFLGTRTAARSRSEIARVVVSDPLE
jgi:hypothetical protein